MKVTDLKENEVIHCETEEQANAICKLMHEAGLKWCSGISYLKYNNFHIYEERTCYSAKTGGYACLDYYKRNDYTIHKAEQFLNTKTMTRTRVLFEEVEEKKLKPIEIKRTLTYGLEFSEINVNVKSHEELYLVSRNYAKGLDVILAKDEGQEDILYLGHWNDGVVE